MATNSEHHLLDEFIARLGAWCAVTGQPEVQLFTRTQWFRDMVYKRVGEPAAPMGIETYRRVMQEVRDEWESVDKAWYETARRELAQWYKPSTVSMPREAGGE